MEYYIREAGKMVGCVIICYATELKNTIKEILKIMGTQDEAYKGNKKYIW